MENVVRLPVPNGGIDDRIARIEHALRKGDTVDPALLVGLKSSQLAMLAARQLNSPRLSQRLPKSLRTQAAMAKALGVARSTIDSAVTVLNHGTPSEIASVEAGKLGAANLADTLRAGLPAKDRAAARAVPANQRGGHPARIAQRRLEAQIWEQLRAGLLGLSSLPHPRDVARLLRDNKQPQVIAAIDARLLAAAAWIEEFADAWTRP